MNLNTFPRVNRFYIENTMSLGSHLYMSVNLYAIGACLLPRNTFHKDLFFHKDSL